MKGVFATFFFPGMGSRPFQLSGGRLDALSHRLACTPTGDQSSYRELTRRTTLLHRAAGGERRSGLGKGHALLRHYAPLSRTLGLAWSMSALGSPGAAGRPWFNGHTTRGQSSGPGIFFALALLCSGYPLGLVPVISVTGRTLQSLLCGIHHQIPLAVLLL